MYSIGNTLKVNKLIYGILFITTLIFVLLLLSSNLVNMIITNYGYNRKIETNNVELISKDNNKTYKKVYYYKINGKQYSCEDSEILLSNKHENDDKKTIYYNSKDPNICTTSIIVKKIDPMILMATIALCIPMLIGLTGIIRINKKIKQIKKLNNCGKLVKNLSYELEKTKMSTSSNIIYKAVVKYKVNNQEHTFYSEPIHDKTLLDKYSTIDLLINENDANDYYLDFNIQVDK